MLRQRGLHCSEGGYAAAYPRPLKSVIQVRCSVGLRIAAKHYAAAWNASLLRTRGSTIALLCASLLWLFLLLFSFLFGSNIDMSYITL